MMENCEPLKIFKRLSLFILGYRFKPGQPVKFLFDGKWIPAIVDRVPCKMFGVVQVPLRDVDIDFSKVHLVGNKTSVPIHRVRRS